MGYRLLFENRFQKLSLTVWLMLELASYTLISKAVFQATLPLATSSTSSSDTFKFSAISSCEYFCLSNIRLISATFSFCNASAAYYFARSSTTLHISPIPPSVSLKYRKRSDNSSAYISFAFTHWKSCISLPMLSFGF